MRATMPRLHAKYIAERLRAASERPWGAEISGRLLSKAHDIASFAISEAARINHLSIKFRHVAFIEVRAVRKDPNLDVFAEPNDRDPAHANLVAYKIPEAHIMRSGVSPKISHDFVRELCSLIQVCDANDLSAIEMLRH